MNEVILIGNLTSDPSLSYTTATQTPVASFRLAVERNAKDKGTDFIQCKIFGRQAEALEHYKSKGDELAVHGRIETGSYKNKDGATVYTTEVICDRIQFTRGSRHNESGTDDEDGGATKLKATKGYPQPTLPDLGELGDTWQSADDDIPF